MMISRSKHRSTVEVCADCGASDPSWASINRGLLLCAECCSVHRSMGRHISHVKSLRQGSWPPSLLAMIQAMTAQNVNSIWEHSLLDTSAPKHLRKKPQPKDPLHPVKSEFILAKHLRLAYVLRARRDEPPAELGRQLHSAVRSGSLDTALRLLAQGADPNYYHQEKGNTCLHVACRAGQPAQAELLAAWGAEPAARDRDGRTPADCARLGGHSELAERLAELLHEAPDRLIQFVTGARPAHAAGRQLAAPRALDAHEMTDVAKAARGKLQLLPNHLFEELVMDIYDEIDRRETEAVWQTSGTGLERCGVVFLPVNPALSAPRNQGRQKLARLSAAELGALCRDVLLDATRRQHIASLHPHAPSPLLAAGHLKHLSRLSDDEPLYDSVASDDDYAALAPADPPTSSAPRADEPEPGAPDVASLRKELDSRDSTITDLQRQLRDLQTVVERLTKENSVLKTSSVDDDRSLASRTSDGSTNGFDAATEPPERGRSLDTDRLTAGSDETDLIVPKSSQRPLTTLSRLDRALPRGVLEPEPAPPPALVHARAEAVTRAIQQLWAAARAAPAAPAAPDRAAALLQHVQALADLFAQTSPEPELAAALREMRAASAAVAREWRALGAAAPLDPLRAAAYSLARATKLLVSHFPLHS